jgi:muramoyltetrapeptide carboxypeptidase
MAVKGKAHRMDIAQITPLKPRRLASGATIGIAAPASPFNKEALGQGVAVLRRAGYQVRLADGLFDAHGYLAGSAAHRAAQLHALFADDTVDALMCARGGFGCIHLLPLLDFDLIRANPKPFVGFSDITVLHQAFFLQTGLVTFHGPMVCTLRPDQETTLNSWQHALVHSSPLHFQVAQGHGICPGQTEGILVGGNLANLCHLTGTPFGANYRGCILFIEDTGEALYRIDRMLTQMQLASCFEGVAGVVLGAFKDCGPEEEIRELFGRLFKATPVLGGLTAGHGEPNLTLPLGLPARLDADAGQLTLLESAIV